MQTPKGGATIGTGLQRGAKSVSDDVFSSLNVMVIEDEVFTQEVVSRILHTIGVKSVVVCENGADALIWLADTEEKIHLVVCDIEMPEMNGYEFVRKVRFGAVAGYKELPVIMLTGKDTDKNIQSARIHKIDGFLVKPAKAATLKAAIRRVLDR